MRSARTHEFYTKLENLVIGTGRIVSLLQRFTTNALPVYQEIKNKIEKSTCVEIDETGVKINGKTHWSLTWRNEALTFIVQSQSRGCQIIAETFPDGLPEVVLVHYRWAPHFQSEAIRNQICLTHLFRELNYCMPMHSSNWAETLKTLLKRTISLNNEAGCDALSDSVARSGLGQPITNLLAHKLPYKNELAIRLQKKLLKVSHHILCFFHYSSIIADSNGFERAIRTIKFKRKVFRGFRSIDGADSIAILRSVIETTIKPRNDVFYALSLIANFGNLTVTNNCMDESCFIYGFA